MSDSTELLAKFGELFDFSILELLGISLLALIPVLIWIPIMHFKKDKSKKTISLIFLLGTLTVMPIIGLQYLWVYFPEFDIYAHINARVTEVHLGFLLTFIFVGIFEEIAKHSVVRYADHRIIKIDTINDAILYSVIAALGFAFTENIFYLKSLINTESFMSILSIFSFRSIVTMCAHMVFAGIMGYFYGISKFADPFFDQEKWEGKKHVILDAIERMIKFRKINSYRISTMLKGLFIAMSAHALFNFFLQFQRLWAAVLLILVGYLYIHHLMRRKAVHLILGLQNKRPSLMGNKDEDVVIQLLGQWTSEGKYIEVKQICERLLKRDPDNEVVKLFQAKAEDKYKIDNAVNAVKSLFSEEDIKTKNIFDKKID